MTSDWLDGPKIAGWLDRYIDRWNQHHTGSHRRNPLSDNHRRRVREWRSGGYASVYVVDEILTHLQTITVHELPDDYFVQRRLARWRRPFPEEFRAEVVAEVHKGRSRNAVAADFGISERSVRDWLQKAEERSTSGPGWPD